MVGDGGIDQADRLLPAHKLVGHSIHVPDVGVGWLSYHVLLTHHMSHVVIGPIEVHVVLEERDEVVVLEGRVEGHDRLGGHRWVGGIRERAALPCLLLVIPNHLPNKFLTVLR